jgi:hypothetical protein
MYAEETNVKEPMPLRKRRLAPANPKVVPAILAIFSFSFKKGIARQNTKSG